MGDNKYTGLLTKANLQSLEIRRIRTMAIETLKILNGLAPPVLSELLMKRENKNNFRYSIVLQMPQVWTSMQGKKSFRYGAPMLWNSLPDESRATLILTGPNLLFSIGMAKIANVQPARLKLLSHSLGSRIWKFSLRLLLASLPSTFYCLWLSCIIILLSFMSIILCFYFQKHVCTACYKSQGSMHSR